jgi:hypothetical protein
VVGPQRRGRVEPTGPDDDQSVGSREREKVGIFLPRGLRQRLRIHAAILDREISELISEAVAEYLDRHDQERAAQGLPPIPLR